MPEISFEDMNQQFAHTVIFYKGKPCKVKTVGAKVKLLNLVTQRSGMVEFSLKDFCPPPLRLGFVNYEETAVYVSRLHARQYQIGLSNNNCRFTIPQNMASPNNKTTLIQKLETFEAPEFADMFFGHYPKLKDAFQHACEFKGAVAFDKQFAVDKAARVFYKTDYVGDYHGEGKIVFQKVFSHLSLLLNKEYAKTTRTFKEKTSQG
jgi:hypothetical protein